MDEGSKPSPRPPISVGQRVVRTARPVPHGGRCATPPEHRPRNGTRRCSVVGCPGAAGRLLRAAWLCVRRCPVRAERPRDCGSPNRTHDPKVKSGHVAGWIGVGAPGRSRAADAWIQVGLNRTPGSGNTLYYEVVRADTYWNYKEIVDDVPTGRPFRVAVLETSVGTRCLARLGRRAPRDRADLARQRRPPDPDGVG